MTQRNSERLASLIELYNRARERSLADVLSVPLYQANLKAWNDVTEFVDKLVEPERREPRPNSPEDVGYL